MNKTKFSLLKQILSQDTAPFREDRVIALITDLFDTGKVPYFIDPVGNVVVGVNSKQAYLKLIQKKSREPVRVFIAHMDHPGFHGMRWLSNNQLKIKWHGGSPVKHLNGAKVWLVSGDGKKINGTLSKTKIAKHGYSMDTAIVRVAANAFGTSRPSARSLYGAFDFKAPIWTSGKRIYTRVADDLTGVFCIASLALDLFSGKNRARQTPFIGLLTRAEEVGFVGAIGHFELAWLKKASRKIVCVSLEASRTLPGAKIGKGPVVRLGDRRTVFDTNGSQVLSTLAQQLLPGRHQRRIMDGGSCEGTAATVYDLPTIALSVPLGNYHNEGFEGGQDCKHPGGPAPEFVHLDDIEGELKLCHALMKNKLPWSTPWVAVKQRLIKNYHNYKRLL